MDPNSVNLLIPLTSAAWLPKIAKRHGGDGDENGEADFADEEDRGLALLVMMHEPHSDEGEAQNDDEHAEEDEVVVVHLDTT